jgi:hypothetical protein
MRKTGKRQQSVDNRPQNQKPPRLSEWLMIQLTWSDDQEAILDNLQEE